MKIVAALILTPLLFLLSCGENDGGEKKIISVEKKEVLKQPVQVTPNQTMTVSVKGMSCEHACGGSIRMALKETGAVDRCSFDFEAERTVNKAFITYDDKKITPEKIISIIETINDKQFTTSDHSVKTIGDKKPAATTGSAESKESAELPGTAAEKETVMTTSGGGSTETTGLLQLFSHILTVY